MSQSVNFIACFILFSFSNFVLGQSTFHPGVAIPEYGKVATVKELDQKIDANVQLKVRFDVGQGATNQNLNRSFETVARFVNMHIEAGIRPENIRLAVVVHGGASWDVTRDEVYQRQHDGADNVNAMVVKKLVDRQVVFYICGQSAAFHGIEKKDLLPGVQVSLSAMTAHALLDQAGYSLNPF